MYKRVFITNQRFNADLGGISGANEKGNTAAIAAGLSGTFKAWLSDSSSSPSTNFTRSTQPYGLVDAANTRIADNWTDLTTCNEGLAGDECLDNPINVNENGIVLPDESTNSTNRSVWTNTLTDGNVDETPHISNCFDFTSLVGSALVGDYASTIEMWTENFLSNSCGIQSRLYCFEQ